MILLIKVFLTNGLRVIQSTKNNRNFNSSQFGAIVKNSSLAELGITTDGMTVCAR